LAFEWIVVVELRKKTGRSGLLLCCDIHFVVFIIVIIIIITAATAVVVVIVAVKVSTSTTERE
jgi:hypothetical protein